MSLVPVKTMFHKAVTEKYAVGYFESWNLESLQGVLDAAEQTRSPVVIGFNGEFISGPDRLATERLSLYGSVGKMAAQVASVPCSFMFNECTRDDWTIRAIDEGFNLIMPIDGKNNFDDYVRRTAEITKRAHQQGVAVEGEVGELPDALDANHEGSFTHPDQAVDFVKRTNVDLLAVSVGNIHCQSTGDQGLDLGLLEDIYRQVRIPLVLHGGTGIDEDALREAVNLGAAKVNYGTYLKRAYLNAVRRAGDTDCADPHRLLGIGGLEDVMVAARHAVRDAVLQRIHLLGCCGKAD